MTYKFDFLYLIIILFCCNTHRSIYKINVRKYNIGTPLYIIKVYIYIYIYVAIDQLYIYLIIAHFDTLITTKLICMESNDLFS